MNRLLIVAVLFVSSTGFLRAEEALKPRVFLLSVEKLEKAKADIAAKEPRAIARYEKLRSRAEKLMKTETFPSVTNNDYVAPGGTKNDYVSFATYYWPDPTKPDGLPFIRKDGESNKEQLRIEKGNDRAYVTEMINSVEALTLAWYLSGNPEYGKRAVRFLRCWFLDPATRMNPHLQYGQGIPGRSHGRGIGIIDTHTLPELVEMLGLLEACPDWSNEDREGVKRWFSEYTDWLRTSKYGIAESKEKNNHGTWYDVQVIAYALYADRLDVARETLEASRRRIDTQIDKDGRQPLELARTLPFSYSTMNLRAWIKLACFGDRYGVDLWNAVGTNGGSIRGAYEYLLPYAEETKEWPYKDLNFKPSIFAAVLRLTGPRFQYDVSKWKVDETAFEVEDFWR